LYRLLLLVLLAACVWFVGLMWFLSGIPAAKDLPTPGSYPKADAIVVLTGGPGRVEHGMELMEAGRAQWMFVSGVYPDTKKDEIFDFAIEQNSVYYGKFRPQIVLGRLATNTKGNAVETASWLHKKGFTKVLLVTADYHMPRASLEFNQFMPGFELITAPSASSFLNSKNWFLSPSALLLLAGEYNKYLISLVSLKLL